MALIFLGILFLTFSFSMPLDSGQAFEVIPDFVGFLLIWFGIEKAKPSGGRLKICSYFAGALLAVHFILFIGQINFLLPNMSLDDILIFKVFFRFIGDIYAGGEALFMAVNLLFCTFLAFALKEESDYDGKVLESVVFFIFGILLAGGAVFCTVHFFAKLTFAYTWCTIPLMGLFSLASLFFGEKLSAFGGVKKEE